MVILFSLFLSEDYSLIVFVGEVTQGFLAQCQNTILFLIFTKKRKGRRKTIEETNVQKRSFFIPDDCYRLVEVSSVWYEVAIISKVSLVPSAKNATNTVNVFSENL